MMTISSGVRYETCSNLLEFVNLHSRYGCPEASDALRSIVSCDVVYFPPIALLILEMREMKAIRTIGMKL